MAYILGTDVEREIVSIQFISELSADAIVLGVTDAIATADDNNWFRLCWDCRSASLDLSTMDIYALPDAIGNRNAGPSIHKYRHAIVYESNLDDFHFLETMFRNRGYTAAVFTDIESAKDWLSAGLGKS